MNKTKKIILLVFALIFMLSFIWKEKYGVSTKPERIDNYNQSSRMSEEKKREIFRDMIIAESRADAEAKLRFPADPETGRDDLETLGDKIEYMNLLTNEYQQKVLEQHNISEEDWDQIANEAVREGWELPER